MNPEIELYKKRRIATLRGIYNTDCKRTIQYYNRLIYNINTSRIVNKAAQIKKLKSDCGQAILLLTQKLNADILAVQNTIPTIDTSFKNKKALLIGINYIGTPAELNGCINDTESIKMRLTTNYGFNVANITTLTDNTPVKPTRANILSHLTNLLANAVSGDLLFFLYSGHGSYTIDTNGDETDRRDEMIIPLDMIGIVDDELKQIIQTNLKKNVTLFALFDSCFSGSVLDLRYQYLDSLNYDSFTENNKQLDTQGNVIMISGCSDKQTSADAIIRGRFNGAMTWSFLECATPDISWRDLLKNMRTTLKASMFPQLPQMSSGSIVNIDHKVFFQTI
jgi:metacaspase-1